MINTSLSFTATNYRSRKRFAVYQFIYDKFANERMIATKPILFICLVSSTFEASALSRIICADFAAIPFAVRLFF